MKSVAIALAVIAALAAGGFAWQRTMALEETRAGLAALRKDLAEEKTASDRLRAERIAAQAFLQAEKAIGARLRDELLKAKEQLALADRPRAVQPAQPPMVIRALPSGSAIGRGVPAR